jgi:hypothetical protein
VKEKWKYVSIQCSSISKRTLLVAGSQVSPMFPSGTSNMEMKMRIVHWWDYSQRKMEVLGEKPVQV